ncbi:MAG: hypothetical protein M0R17_05985 [Candidatus Omnitrophica bacterium]|jgi:hypothetical protein|nr:hypothetical protein [Candidatus Omnitrophota bacterium]
MVEKGLKLPTKIKELTNSEKEILHLLSDEFFTIKQVAQRRDCSIQYVYKVIKSLKKKGEIDVSLNKTITSQSTFNQTDVRLHGQEINIRILWQDNKYQKIINNSNTIYLDSNTIRLYKNSIEIYSGQSFYGKTASESEKSSCEYWFRFITRLANDLNIILIKKQSRNIKIVNQHFARGDSEICDDSIKNRERVWVYAEEDGKLAFITDDSFGFKEDETVHPTTSKSDRKAIDKQINDWRINNPPTISEVSNNLKTASEIILSNQELISNLPNVLNRLEKEINSHLKLIKEYRKENKLWRKSFKKKVNNQLTLRDWF